MVQRTRCCHRGLEHTLCGASLGRMKPDSQQQLSMLRILYGTCSAALDAFRAADNTVDAQLVADLEKMVERTRVEAEHMAERLAGGPPAV